MTIKTVRPETSFSAIVILTVIYEIQGENNSVKLDSVFQVIPFLHCLAFSQFP